MHVAANEFHAANLGTVSDIVITDSPRNFYRIDQRADYADLTRIFITNMEKAKARAQQIAAAPQTQLRERHQAETRAMRERHQAEREALESES